MASSYKYVVAPLEDARWVLSHTFLPFAEPVRAQKRAQPMLASPPRGSAEFNEMCCDVVVVVILSGSNPTSPRAPVAAATEVFSRYTFVVVLEPNSQNYVLKPSGTS